MNQYCTAIGSYNIIPNPFESFIDKNASTMPYHEAYKMGIKSSVFILNIGPDLAILLIFIIFLPMVILLSSADLGKISSKFKEKLHEYKYDVFIKFWVQTYLNFGVFSIINYESVINKKDSLNGGATYLISKIFSSIYLVILKQVMFFLTPIALLFGLYINYDYIKNNNSPEFVRRYGTLITEFEQDRGFKFMLYYPIYTLRRLIYAIFQIYLNNYPFIQKFSHLVFGLTTLLYLIAIKPHKEKLALISNIVIEGLLCLIFIQILVMHFYPNLMSEDSLITIFISIIMSCLGFQYIITLVMIGLQIRELFKSFVNSKEIHKVITNSFEQRPTTEDIIK